MISKGFAQRYFPQRGLSPYSREKLKSTLAIASWHMSYSKPVEAAVLASGLVSMSVSIFGLAEISFSVSTVAPMQRSLPSLPLTQALAHNVPSADALSLFLKSREELVVLSDNKDLSVAMIIGGRFHTRATCKALKVSDD
jgi:hypothetical protein